MKEDLRTEQIVLNLDKHEYNRFINIAKHFNRTLEDVILILANKNFYTLEECRNLKTNSFNINKNTAPGKNEERRENPKLEQIYLDIEQDIVDIKKILLANNAYIYSSASKKLDQILEKLRSLK